MTGRKRRSSRRSTRLISEEPDVGEQANWREREILRRLYGEKLQRSSMKRAPNPPYGKWLNVQGSPVKKIRFRKGGNVDVVIVPRARNESYRKVKKQVRKLQQSGALEPGPMFQKFRKAQKISKTGRKRNWNDALRYSGHQLPNKQWEIIDRATGRVVQTVKTKSATLQALTKWNAREGLSGAWQMRSNPSSYIVYPGSGSPKSFGFLKSAKKWAKEQANASGISSVIYPQGKGGTTHHVYPDRKAKNPLVSTPTTFHTKFGKYQLLPKRVHSDGTVDFLYSERGIGQDFSVGSQDGISGPLPKYAHGNAKKLARIARAQIK